jgi:hypothetical protein
VRSARPAIAIKSAFLTSAGSVRLAKEERGQLRAMNAAQVVGTQGCALRAILGQQAQHVRNAAGGAMASDQPVQAILARPVAPAAGDCQHRNRTQGDRSGTHCRSAIAVQRRSIGRVAVRLPAKADSPNRMPNFRINAGGDAWRGRSAYGAPAPGFLLVARTGATTRLQRQLSGLVAITFLRCRFARTTPAGGR